MKISALIRSFALSILFAFSALALYAVDIVYTVDLASPDGIVGQSTLAGSTSTLVSGLGRPRGIAVDSTNERIYYAPNSGIIAYTNFTGSSQTTVIASGAGNGTRGMAVDPSGGFIYWAAFVDGTINRATLAGGSQTALISGLDTPGSVSIDTVNSKLYWVERGTTQQIARSDLDGSNIETVVSSVDVDGGYVAVDPVNSYLFFNSRGGGNTLIQRTDLDGNNATTLATIPTTSISFEGLVADAATQTLYFANSDATGSIESIAYTGGSITTIATGVSSIHALALIPEPSTYVLIVSGAVMLFVIAFRLRAKARVES